MPLAKSLKSSITDLHKSSNSIATKWPIVLDLYTGTYPCTTVYEFSREAASSSGHLNLYNRFTQAKVCASQQVQLSLKFSKRLAELSARSSLLSDILGVPSHKRSVDHPPGKMGESATALIILSYLDCKKLCMES